MSISSINLNSNQNIYQKKGLSYYLCCLCCCSPTVEKTDEVFSSAKWTKEQITMKELINSIDKEQNKQKQFTVEELSKEIELTAIIASVKELRNTNYILEIMPKKQVN